jgi:hypothetical protein
MGGVSAQEQALGPFSVLQNPNRPSPRFARTKNRRGAVPVTSNEARQRRLHDRRTRRAFSPHLPPHHIGTTLRAINKGLRVQRHLPDDAIPLALAPLSDSGLLLLHPEDDSIDLFPRDHDGVEAKDAR